MRWAVILAGGSIRRLQAVNQSVVGDERPRQFCPLIGGESPFSYMQSVVRPLVDDPQLFGVVTREHEPFYRRELAHLNPYQVIEQPLNRGTAAAIAFGA